jgi:RHS repeat-associated protein
MHHNSTYDAFGTLKSTTGTTRNSYLFAGEQWDEKLDEYYLRQRFYRSTLGRFTGRDSFEGQPLEPLTLHKYVYANANPVSYVDYSGYFSFSINEAVVVNVLAGILASMVFTPPVLSPTNSQDTEAYDPSTQRFLLEMMLGSISLRAIPNLAYSIEQKALVSLDNLAAGTPRTFASGFLPLDALSRAARVLDRGGLLTRAGRALQKHANRAGSAFPLPKGNEVVLNRTGQDIVDDILTDPGVVFTTRTSGRFGDVIDVVASDGRGVRFSIDGEFLHFLEPPPSTGGG